MHRNNFVPTIVDRGARRAARWIGCISLSYEKSQVHRAYRHRIKRNLDMVAKGFVEPDEFDDSRPYSCRLTAWDVD